MYKIAIGMCALALVGTGCAHKKETVTALQEQSISGKPVVSIVPLIDHSNSGLSWSLSEEFTRSICQKLNTHEKLHLENMDSIRSIVKKLSEKQDPFSLQTSWIKKAFNKSEYVVFMELIEHSEKLLYAQNDNISQESPAEFNISVRLRVFDLKGPEPKIVLQEIISDSQRVPKQFTSVNFYQVPWGHEIYDISPLGMAHAQIFKEIAGRIEEYILLSDHR